MNTRAFFTIAFAFAAFTPAFADPEGGDKPAEKKPEKKDEFPKFEEVTKDMEVRDGLFTLYYDKQKDVLLAKIPKALLDEPFLMGVSIAKGPVFASWMLGGGAVYWDRIDKQLVLMESDTRYAKSKGSTVEDVVGRTYTDTIIKAIDIKTEASGGDPVVDLGDLLKTDLIGLGRMYDNRRLDRSLSRWSTMKAFPDNVELAVDAALMGNGPNSEGLIASVHLSMSKLPKNDYKPREADDRIGYFMTAQKDWSLDHNDKTIFKRYIHRWDLQKQDPKAAESPVKEPIVFYIEKTVPVKFRRYVREGIADWNKAFAKCGLLDAVQVRQQSDDNEFKDLDPEDTRYNFLRWIVSGRAFARGPSRVNPFTGQILDADIVFDDSMVRFYVQEGQLMNPSAYDALSDPRAEDFYAQFPEYRFKPRAKMLTPDFAAGKFISDGARVTTSESLFHEHDETPCELGTGIVQQLAFSQLLSAQMGVSELPEAFIGQVIREIVCHEVGHTLGLRHNFKGSNWLKLSDILSKTGGDRAISGSIMDYNPAEYAGSVAEQGDFVTSTIGPYDYWAIEYGYRPFMAAGEIKSEQDMLKLITGRVAEAGLEYATDEDTSDFGPDPFTYRYDNGDDPLAYAQHRMDLAKRLMKELDQRAVAEGESYARLRRAFNIVMNEYEFSARIAARMVGGQSVRRDHKGDPSARTPIEIVPVEKQRQAVAMLGKTVFSDEFFQFDPVLLNKLGPGRFLHWDSDQMDTSIDYDIHDRILAMQSRAMTLVINPITVNRIYDAEAKVPRGQDALTVPELIDSVTKTIWSELDADGGTGPFTERNPRISSTRRNLQREHLGRMISILLTEPGMGLNADCYSVVRMNIKDLSGRIAKTLDSSRARLDTYTLAHLDEAKQRIDKVLAAEFVNGESRN